MTLPALRDASEDVALRGAPLSVYLWLLHHLDVQEVRCVKLLVIGRALRMKEETASAAIRLLVRRGYVQRRHTGTRGYAYRLLYARAVPEHPASGESQAS